MIQRLGQVMLYVDHQDAAVKFWTEKVGFQVIAEEGDGQGMRWIEVAPSKAAETSIVIHNKELVARMSPGINLGAPSLMFYTDNIDQLHSDLLQKDVKVGEIVQMPFGSVFNFADDEENYFAVVEK